MYGWQNTLQFLIMKVSIISLLVALFSAISVSFADGALLDEIPPTIMFHARANQRDMLADFIDEMRADGYQFMTYRQFYEAFQRGERLEKPIILTFDDLTLVEGSGNFHYYAQIVEILEAKSVPAVFGVVTEPVIVGNDGELTQLTMQNEEYWSQARAWTAQGIEFATHTESHPNLDNPMLSQTDLNREIA